MSAESIRKIRMNFIFLSMMSFIVVMLFIGGLINISNNFKIRHDVQEMLDYIIANDGDIREDAAEEYSDLEEGEEDPEGFSSFLEDVPEFQYSTRYFAVLYNAEGAVEDIKLSHIRSVDHRQAVEASDRVLQRRSSFGNYGDYFFYKRAERPQGGVIVVLINASTLINLNNSIIRSTILICSLGLLITFLAVLEMIKGGEILVDQEKNFGDLYIRSKEISISG